jgi:hypothetical protein
MSHFYGIISESARKNAPTARAHHSLKVEAQSWKGKIVTILTREKDGDYYDVWREPHHSSGGETTDHEPGMQPWLDGLEHNENKNKTFRLQATSKPQATSTRTKEQATSNKQKKGGTRPQAHTRVRGVMSH